MVPAAVNSRSSGVAPDTRHAPSTTSDDSSVAPAAVSLETITDRSARFATTRKGVGGIRLFEAANDSASSRPNAVAQRSINQTGCEVLIAILSSGSETSAAGSKSGSLVERLSTALTSADAELKRAARTRFTDSLTAAEGGMRVR